MISVRKEKDATGQKIKGWPAVLAEKINVMQPELDTFPL